MSTFSLLQQQRGVPRESAAAEHLTLIAVAAPRMHADDVIIGETASSMTQKKPQQCRVWEAIEAQADVASPVFVQIPPQVPDGF